MPQQQLLATVLRVLEESNCQYMLTGSFVSSLQGDPRLTHDIDLVAVIGGFCSKANGKFSPAGFLSGSLLQEAKL